MLQGLKEYSVPIGLEAKVKVDLVVIGSVAVSKEGKTDFKSKLNRINM